MPRVPTILDLSATCLCAFAFFVHMLAFFLIKSSMDCLPSCFLQFASSLIIFISFTDV